jgi:hypothetical protein
MDGAEVLQRAVRKHDGRWINHPASQHPRQECLVIFGRGVGWFYSIEKVFSPLQGRAANNGGQRISQTWVRRARGCGLVGHLGDRKQAFIVQLFQARVTDLKRGRQWCIRLASNERTPAVVVGNHQKAGRPAFYATQQALNSFPGPGHLVPECRRSPPRD